MEPIHCDVRVAFLLLQMILSFWLHGVIFDQYMIFDYQVTELVQSCFLQLRNIAKIRCISSSADLELLIHTFIFSHLDYCNSLYTCLSQAALNRLQLVQNAAARLLTRTSRQSHITPVLASLHWLPVKFTINYNRVRLNMRPQHRKFTS